jgi:rare lipoprotein A
MIANLENDKATLNIGVLLRFFIIIVVLSVFLLACATAPPPTPPGHPKPYKVGRKWYKPLPSSKGFTQRGIASWYGKPFHGRKTANGETYNMYALSAAHKTLPLGTWVRVHNLKNGKKLDVRINDRGPFIRGRIIDLSFAAAKKIGLVGPGVVKVEITTIRSSVSSKSKPDKSLPQVDYYTGNFTIQIAAFKNRKNALLLKRKLDESYKNVHISSYDSGRGIYYRVRVGMCHTLTQAIEYEKIMLQKGFQGAFVVAE